MSQQLASYITAKHDAIAAVLEMLTAEWQLSDEHSSVLDLTGTECEVDAVASPPDGVTPRRSRGTCG